MNMESGAWLIAFLFLGIMVALIVFSLKRIVELDLRLASGDLGLLNSGSYRVTEVIRAPLGSRVDATPNMMLTTGVQMVPVILPDGRVGLMPLSAFIQQQRH
jgi:hypothetical protein